MHGVFSWLVVTVPRMCDRGCARIPSRGSNFMMFGLYVGQAVQCAVAKNFPSVTIKSILMKSVQAVNNLPATKQAFQGGTTHNTSLSFKRLKLLDAVQLWFYFPERLRPARSFASVEPSGVTSRSNSASRKQQNQTAGKRSTFKAWGARTRHV